MYGLNGGLAHHSQLAGGQKNCSALAIILFANKYSQDMEEGATHEET
jgi:hypothetical protein